MTAEVEKVEKERIRKRPRLAWDVGPSEPEVGSFSGHQFRIELGFSRKSS